MNPDDVRRLIRIAICCREWPVLAVFHIGRCGYCNTRPVIVR